MRIDHRLTLFDTYWFVMVTVTTVGYGDISPSHWTTRLLVTLFIIIGVVRLVPQLEELYKAFMVSRHCQMSLDALPVSINRMHEHHLVVYIERNLYDPFLPFPSQLQQQLNNSVGYRKTRNHIIICSTHFKRLVLMDFLNEFYSNSRHKVSTAIPIKIMHLYHE